MPEERDISRNVAVEPELSKRHYAEGGSPSHPRKAQAPVSSVNGQPVKPDLSVMMLQAQEGRV